MDFIYIIIDFTHVDELNFVVYSDIVYCYLMNIFDKIERISIIVSEYYWKFLGE